MPAPHGGNKRKPWTRYKFTKVAKRNRLHLIEESDRSFTEVGLTGMENIQITSHSATINMLPEDHPLYHHLNKLFDDFRKLSDAVDALKFYSTVAHSDLMSVQTCLDTVDDTLGEMATIRATPE